MILSLAYRQLCGTVPRKESPLQPELDRASRVNRAAMQSSPITKIPPSPIVAPTRGTSPFGGSIELPKEQTKTDWIKLAASTQMRAAREEVVQRTKKCDQTQNSELDLTKLRFGNLEIRMIPDHVKTLTLSDCNLASLNEILFPPHLEALYALGNSFNHLDLNALPKTLKTLYLPENEIETISGNWPPDVEEVYLHRNSLLHVPPLPPKVKKVILSNNRIQKVEKGSFPSSVLEIDLSDNQITSFPWGDLPPLLESLHLTNNCIQIASSSEEAASACAYFGEEETPAPPVIKTPFPETLKHIDLIGNLLSQIPDNWALPLGCVVILK